MKQMTVLLMFMVVAAAVAQETDTGAMDMTQGWTTTVDLSYTTRYIWRGFDILDNCGALQPSVDFAHESGLGANIWMSYAERGGSTSSVASRVNLTEYDYTLYYGGKVLEGDTWETDYTIGWRYYDFIDTYSKSADAQEIFIEAEMPQVTGTAVVPHVAIYQMWPAKSGSDISGTSGTIYVVGLTYLLPTEEQLPDVPLIFSWDIVYNDGAGADVSGKTTAVDSDLSHMVWGLSSSFDCPFVENAKITPAVYFQNSFESSVNPSDEYWMNLSYSITF